MYIFHFELFLARDHFELPGRLGFVAAVYKRYVHVRLRAGDVTTQPGYVLFKFKQAKGGMRGGLEELEECQTLDWISMNSKEADRGDGDGVGWWWWLWWLVGGLAG